MRLLTFSTLYPNKVMPQHGIFVETRLRHLVASGRVETRVVAPVPWFPFHHAAFGAYAVHAAVPAAEVRHGLQVTHPRFVRLPKIGMSSAPFTLARTAIRAARRLIAEGYDFDIIDAHYFYPDGVAAAMLGKALGKPVVITARGTDINVIPQHALPRRMILNAARDSAATITVCQALKDRLVELGAGADKITVLRNGVDLAQFHPEERIAARAAFGMTGFSLVSVGNLIASKGHELAVEALVRLPDARLLIAGRGPDENRLRELAGSLGVADRLEFLGLLPQDRLRQLYSGADALVLASVREGWANVLLEAMACGTPVVASNVGGTPEVVAAPEAGIMMAERSADGVVDAVTALRQRPPCRAATRRYAERFSWDETTAGVLALFTRVMAESKHPAKNVLNHA